MLGRGRGAGLGTVGKAALLGLVCDNRWGCAVWEGAEETEGRGKGQRP